MFGDAVLATRMADTLLTKGVYVVGFSYPVVPQGKARIRVQISAAHTAGRARFRRRPIPHFGQFGVRDLNSLIPGSCLFPLI